MQIPIPASSTARARSRLAPQMRLRCHGPDDASRPAVQAFVAAVYAQHFDARVTTWTPMMVSLEVDGEIVAAAGYRTGRQALFLERYLGQPVEHAIAARCGVAVMREQIVEIGHLASARAGSGRQLMRALADHLQLLGLRWAVVTATAELRAILDRLLVQSVTLAPAEPGALGAAAALWGSYYTHAPQVIAGKMAGNVERLREAVGR
jgi:hypothetical protein